MPRPTSVPTPRRRRSARLVALVAAPALTLGLLPAGAARAADPSSDPSVAGAAAGWLASGLDQGLFTYDVQYGSQSYSYTDYGAGVDTAVAFDEVGGHAADVTAIGDALKAHFADYTSSSYTDGGHTYDSVYANAVAKAVVGLQAAGIDPTTVATPSGNALSELESLVGSDGQIADVNDEDGTAMPGATDYANVFGQAFAVQALSAAGSAKATSAATFLVSQQCSDSTDGFFAETFAPQGTDACDGTPSVDATGTALSALVRTASTNGVTPGQQSFSSISGLNYLLAAERPDGGWATGATGSSDANSTGLAVSALSDLAQDGPTYGHYATPAAETGAAWLRAHRLVDVGACRPIAAADLGAVAYDDDALTTARTAGVTDATRGQFIQATAQSTAGLLQVPAASGALRVSAPTGFVKAGSVQRISVSRVAPGGSVCLTGSGSPVEQATSSTGATSYRVTVPRSTGTATYHLTDESGTTIAARVTRLAAARLGVRTQHRVRRGSRQRVVVTHLVTGEPVVVRVRGKRVAHGTAGRGGRFVARYSVPRRGGRAVVSAVGRFADRSGSTKVTLHR